MALQELEYDHSIFAAPTNELDKKLFVKFYPHFIQDDEATIEAGRPVFKDAEFIMIMVPGDRTNIIQRPVRRDDTVRFKAQYDHFKSFGEHAIMGTPLREWPVITRAMAETLISAGFQTVEQLAEARDDVVLKIPGLSTLKTKAANYLIVAQDGAKASILDDRLQKLEAANELLQRQLKEVGDTLDEERKLRKGK